MMVKIFIKNENFSYEIYMCVCVRVYIGLRRNRNSNLNPVFIQETDERENEQVSWNFYTTRRVTYYCQSEMFNNPLSNFSPLTDRDRSLGVESQVNP